MQKSTKCQPREYTFLKDSNVTGKLYERNWFALMALRGCQQDMEDMWIGFNMTDFNKFDDVVMYCKTNDNREVIYCTQVKLKSGNLQKKQLLGTSGDFSLPACQESYSRIKNSIRNFEQREIDFKCVFVTNSTFTSEKSEKCLVLLEDNFFNSCPNSKTFHLDAEEIINNCEQKLDIAYVSSVYFSTSQLDATRIESAIKEELQKLLNFCGANEFDVNTVASGYLTFINKWVQGDLGNHKTLTKTIILYKLIELITEKQRVNFDGMPSLSDVKKFSPIYLWNFLMNSKHLILLKATDDCLRFVSNLILYKISQIYAEVKTKTWGDRIENGSFYETFTDGIIKSEMLRCVSKIGKIHVDDLYKVLWKIGKIPLVLKIDSVKFYVQVMSVLKLINYAIDVIFISSIDLSDLPNFDDSPVVIKSLFDLNYNAKIAALNLNVLLQGKGPFKARDIIDFNDESVLQQISLSDLIAVMNGDFNIGNDLEILPEVHIRRTVPRIGLQPSVLKCRKEKFFIYGNESRLNDYINTNKFLTFDFTTMEEMQTKNYMVCSEFDEEFNDFCKNSPNACGHFLLLHGCEQLEWIKSNGGVANIAQYTMSPKLDPIAVEDVASHFTNSVNIISADPGAGKTILMHYLALMSRGSIWVLQIDLNKYMSYYDSENFCNTAPEDHLRFFNREILKNTGNLTAINEVLFERFLKSKNLLVLLDGYDEIAPLYTKEVNSLALSLTREGYSLWLTTRPVMREHVEKVFATFSLTLNLFTEDEQTLLLRAYFKTFTKPKDYCQIKSVSKFTSEILTKCKRYFNDFDNKFMGIPLQIFFLGQVFADSCAKYVSTGQMEVLNFDMLYLYDKFTRMKINIVVAKFGQSVKFTQKNLHENHCLYALKVLFPKEDLSPDFENYLNEKTASFMDDVKDATDKTGIVVANINVNFVHRSISEYFAAKWLSENLNNSKFSDVARKLLIKILDPNFYVIRNVFDRILAKESVLLTAVINHNYLLVNDLIKLQAKDVDGEGRNALCIAAAWGEPHELPTLGKYSGLLSEVKQNSNSSKIMALLLDKEIPYTKDPLLNMTPLDWAIKTQSLRAADQLLKKFHDETLNIEALMANDYLYVCAKFNYVNLASKIFSDWNSPLFLQIDASVEGMTLLQLASQRGCTDMVQLLLNQGADPSLKNRNGMTALDYATRNNHLHIRLLLGRTDSSSLPASSPVISSYFDRSFRNQCRLNELDNLRRMRREDKIEELRQKRRERK